MSAKSAMLAAMNQPNQSNQPAAAVLISRAFNHTRRGLLLFLLLTLGATACATPTPTSPLPAVADSLTAATLEHILALETIAPRAAGSAPEPQAPVYFAATFAQAGYEATRQDFSFSNHGQSGSSANISAVRAGTTGKQIIIGAHYDSVNVGRGVDDNASGVGLMLALAAQLRELPTKHTLVFIAFGAEEVGLRGSSAYALAMSEAAVAATLVMINLDSLAVGDYAYLYGDAGPDGRLRDWLLARAATENLDLRTQDGSGDYPVGTTIPGCSDFAPFARRGIQHAYFEATNWTLGERDGYTQVPLNYGVAGEIWHTRHDTSAYIEATFPGRMTQRLALFGRLLLLAATEFG